MSAPCELKGGRALNFPTRPAPRNLAKYDTFGSSVALGPAKYGSNVRPGHLPRFWTDLGPSSAIVGRSWAHLRRSWAVLGPILGDLGPILGPSWAILGDLSSVLGRSWAHVERTWADLGLAFSVSAIFASALPNVLSDPLS